MKSLLLSFLLASLSSVIFSASAFADQGFLAKTRIVLGGSEVGSPALRLTPGVASLASVEGSYDLSLIATDAGNDQVLIDIKLTTDGETQSPMMQVKYGEEASFETGGTFFSVIVVKEKA